MIVRRAVADDVAFVADLDWRAMHEPYLLGLPEVRLGERREASFQVWPSFFAAPESRVYVGLFHNERLGFAAVRCIVGEAELDAIAVEPRARKAGVGRALLAFTIADLFAAKTSRIGLEVREKNTAARGLYTAYGFEQEGVRRSYYENGDDAILFGLSLERFSFR